MISFLQSEEKFYQTTLILVTLFQEHNFGCLVPYNLKFAAFFLQGIVLSCIDLKMAANFKLHGSNHLKTCY